VCRLALSLREASCPLSNVLLYIPPMRLSNTIHPLHQFYSPTLLISCFFLVRRPEGYSFFLVNFFHNGAHDVTNHTSFCFSPPKQIKKNHSTASLCGVLVHASNVFFKLYSQLQFISMLYLQRVFLVYLVHACCKFLYRRGYNQSALIQSFVVASVHICILMNFYIVSYFFCWYVHLLFEYLSAILL